MNYNVADEEEIFGRLPSVSAKVTDINGSCNNVTVEWHRTQTSATKKIITLAVGHVNHILHWSTLEHGWLPEPSHQVRYQSSIGGASSDELWNILWRDPL
jgi:hypothetical protein